MFREFPGLRILFTLLLVELFQPLFSFSRAVADLKSGVPEHKAEGLYGQRDERSFLHGSLFFCAFC